MWAICKSKQAKLYIRFIHKEVLYSYSRIPLTESEVAKTLVYAPFKESKRGDNDEILEYVFDKNDNPEKYAKLLKRIGQLAKQHQGTSSFEISPSKSYNSTVVGTSRLIRSKDYSKIHIARRKNTNRNSINSVCIDDILREEFFADSKKYNGYPDDGKYYVFKENSPETFSKWSNRMDNLYKAGAKQDEVRQKNI